MLTLTKMNRAIKAVICAVIVGLAMPALALADHNDKGGRRGNRDRDRFERDFDRNDRNDRRRDDDDDDHDRRGKRFLKVKKHHNHPWWENDDRDNRRGRRRGNANFAFRLFR